MITGTHTIELLVEGERLDIYSQEKLNLRINNVVFDPVQVNNKTGEYSFSFNLPATPKNNRIFNYANNSSKDNKFTIMRNCDVIADGETIFSGIIRLSESSTGDYKCNLVNVKVNNIEDIFGEMKLNEISWEIPFEGTSTITTMNNVDPNVNGVYFPLACYGVFPKLPYASYNNGDINYYTDILDIDEYNRWYWESFKPSMQLTSLVRRYFNAKGYEVAGDFFDDETTNDIYLSTYISDEQDPYLNLGNPTIGKLILSGSYNNFGQYSNVGYRGGAPRVRQSLSFPRDQVTSGSHKFDDYNFDEIFIYDILGTPFSDAMAYRHNNLLLGSTNSYMYRHYGEKDKGGYIYIPHDGLYSIRLQITNLGYDVEADNLKYVMKEGTYSSGDYRVNEKEVTMPKTWSNCPVEFHLMRNGYETELIGSADPLSGNPPDTAYMQYPHEMDYTKLKTSSRGTSSGATSTAGGHNYGGTRSGSIDPTGGGRTGTSIGFGGNRSGAQTPEEQFYAGLGTTICYDPWVNPNFICGFSSLNRSAAVMKNGGSWNPECGDYNQNHYNCGGYWRRDAEGNITMTDYNQNTLVGADGSFNEDGGTAKHKNGYVDVVMELKAGDCISLYMITKVLKSETREERNGSSYRGFTMDNDYMLSFNYNITITPYTPYVDKYVGSKYMTNKLPTEEELESGWGKNLKLEQWLHKDEKVSDWINNVIKTFNLKYTIDGNTVSLNLGKNKDTGMAYVDIDDRVNTDNATFSRIEYPSFMEVKFSIAEDEAGAYRSIPTVQQQGASNWKDYIDRGSEKIVMDMSETNTSQTVESKFSYNWWQTFKKSVDLSVAETGTNYELIRIPLICKDENFIIYSDEAASKDGLGLKQRMWYKGLFNRIFTLWNEEKVSVRLPQEKRWGIDVINFKNEEGSMIDKYFNITPMLDSNFCTVEVYLTPKEYLMLKNGASVKFDDDFYMVSEISGYDPSGNNQTTLKMIKRTK